MELEFCYNPNVGAASRGTESDVANITISDDATSVEDAVKKVYAEVFDLVGEDLEDATEGDYTPEYLIQFGDDQDITGGFPILFWVNIDGKQYESSWEESEFEYEDDEFEYVDEDVTDLLAVDIAFPKLSDKSKNIIADWYRIEGTSEDFETNEDYAAYITRDIISMLYAGDYTGEEEMALQQDLVACGYFDKDELPGFEEDSERVTEDYHHPNASICDCSSCGRPSSEVDIHTVADFVGDTYDLDDFCEVEAIDPAETICAECFEQAEADYLKATEPSEYNENGIDLRTGEPWGEYQWFEPELGELED